MRLEEGGEVGNWLVDREGRTEGAMSRAGRWALDTHSLFLTNNCSSSWNFVFISVFFLSPGKLVCRNSEPSWLVD